MRISRAESNTSNEKLLQKYFTEKIASRKTKKTSKDSLEYSLRRGLTAIGELSIVSTDISDLQKAIDAADPDQRQRQLVTYLNSMLHWLGRKDKLQPQMKEARDVKFIPLNQLGKVIERLPSRAWQVAVIIAVNSGLRIGELFALDARSLMAKGFKVDFQIERDGSRSRPKRGKRRTVAVFTEAIELFEEWLDVKDQITQEERNYAARILRRACMAAYPKNPEWHLRFHDLRHSYAIAACDKGMTLEWLAKQWSAHRND